MVEATRVGLTRHVLRVRALTFVGDEPVALPAAIAGLTIAALLRQGAFHADAALVVGSVALILLALGLVRFSETAGIRRVIGVLGALVAWWLFSAVSHGSPASFLPLGASMVGFASALVCMRPLGPRGRRLAAGVFVGIGTASAAAGLVAVAFRLFPVAARAQNVWRVSTTLNYANAGGLLLGMALLVAFSLDQRLGRLSVCLCAAGLVATQSRGAVLSTLVALCLVPRANLTRVRWALGAGVAAGLAVIGMSRGDGVRWGDLVVVVAAAALASALPAEEGGSPRRRVSRRLWVGAAGVGVAVVGAAGLALRGYIARRLNQDRLPEWSAAVHQWRSALLAGVGPDKPLVLEAATRTTASFAHSEYLQVLAGSGTIGVEGVGDGGGTNGLGTNRPSSRGCGRHRNVGSGRARPLGFEPPRYDPGPLLHGRGGMHQRHSSGLQHPPVQCRVHHGNSHRLRREPYLRDLRAHLPRRRQHDQHQLCRHRLLR